MLKHKGNTGEENLSGKGFKTLSSKILIWVGGPVVIAFLAVTFILLTQVSASVTHLTANELSAKSLAASYDINNYFDRHMEIVETIANNNDLIARWGGDEFVILMPDTSLEEAEETAANIKDTNIVIEGVNLSVSLSIGSACKNIAGDSIQIAMQQAEKYMYHQKLLDGKSFRNAIISTLLATLYEKSNETEEHSKRMEKYCHDIGRRLQLSSKEMDELSLLALLHDIGKVSINPNILQKPGPLTNTEWDEMKRHPEIGYRIAQATPELAVVSELILSHHERWDGKGYPRGLKGTAIPLSCRILAVADAYDAMTNDRVYRSAMSGEEAVKELEKNAGTQFEAGIVRFFIDSLKSED